MKRLICSFFRKSILLSAIFSIQVCFADADPTAALNVNNVQSGEYIASRTYNTPGITNEVEFHGLVTVSGDITFTADAGKVLNVSIGKGDANTNPVILKPYLSTPSRTNQFTNLIFNPSQDGIVSVDLYTDLYVTGSNLDNAKLATGQNPVNYSNTEIFLTFQGKGTTVINIADGRKFVASSLIEQGGSISTTTPPALLSDRKPLGARLQICMDQNQQEVVMQGRNKLIVQRKDFALAGNNNDCEFKIGLNSLLTFISKNYTGLDISNNPGHSNIGNNTDGTFLESYAAMAFDVSVNENAKGRMLFTIDGEQSAYNTYTDGAVSICGNYLQDRLSDTTAQPGAYSNSAQIRQYVNLSQAAGCKAFLRVNDNQKFFYDKSLVNQTYIPSLNPTSGEVGFIGTKSSRRGLHISCSNKSLRALAANGFGDGGWYSQEIFTSGRGNSGARPGFTLGVNGHMEISHNTFVEYESKTPNIELVPFDIGMSSLHALILGAGATPDTLFKTRSPSSLLVDGLGSVIISSSERIRYQAHIDEALLRRAEITLYGNAGLVLRAPLLTGTTAYDGKRLSCTGETFGDGIGVMDIEGSFTVRSFPDTSIPDGASIGSGGYPYGLHYGSGYASAGTMRLGSLMRSYDDREVFDTLGLTSSYVTRPLVLNPTNPYKRYDRPSIIVNSQFDFINLDYHHEDASRYINTNVNQSPATFMGGERAYFLNRILEVENPDIPFMKLYNTNIHCHESICLSGLRLIVRELPDILSLNNVPESNSTSIIMYNHGNELDTNIKGFSRIFLMGSGLNRTSDGLTTSTHMQSCNFNIFRDTGADPVTAANPFNLPVKLALKTKAEVPSGVSTDEHGIQMFFMGNESNVEVGWTSEVGIYRDNSDTTVFPWDHRLASEISSNSNKFNLRADIETPATLSFEGDYLYLGGSGPNGEPSPSVVDQLNLGRVVYMGHGSKIQITQDTTNPSAPRPYVGFSDASIAIRLWKIEQPALNTQISLPFDQFKLKYPIRPYAIDMNVLTDNGNNKNLRISALTGIGLGTEVSLAWNLIIKKPSTFTLMSSRSMDLGRNFSFHNEFFGQQSRSINILSNPVTMPASGLLMMSTGDYLDQLAISGATLADPFLLYMTGDNNGISQVRELTTVDSTSIVPGEGSFAKIFLDQGARVGLGSRSWNDKSIKAWNLIGKNFVTIIPNGDCQVDVNSDLVVADAQPLIPTTNFGSSYLNPANASQTIQPTHRITFFSHDTREVRVPAGHELDLSAFGKATVTSGSQFTQQIAFGGKLKLIFEPGSTLRFPNLSGINVANMPVLYMNENTEIIFESIRDMENKYAGDPVLKARWSKMRDSDRAKIKILGVGQIWLNKTSKMSINDGAIVSVEADATTPNTDVTLSLQRNGACYIGTTDSQGGFLQVGNPRFNTDGTPFTVASGNINFTLRQASETTLFYMGRKAFLGFGAGIIDGFEDTMNNRWKFQPLNYVNNVSMKLISGVFSHNQIYDGSSKDASLMAIGPVSGGYLFETGSTGAALLGGGNLMYVGNVTTALPTDAPFVNILSSAVPLSATIADSTDNGKYSIMNSSLILQRITSLPNQDTNTVLKFVNSGITPGVGARAFSESAFNTVTGSAKKSFGFYGQSRDAFKYLAFKNFKDQNPSAYVTFGKNIFEKRIGYVSAASSTATGSITRSTNLLLRSGISSASVDGIKVGVLKSATPINGQPSSNGLPE